VIPILLALAAIQSPVAAAPPAEAAENPAAVAAPDAAAEDRYRACTAQVRAEPLRATETANAWQRVGGGLLARQCLGLAYVALERWEPAATVYEQAARDAAAARDPRNADFWVQAGNAWLAGSNATRAVQAFDAALATTTLSDQLRGEVHVDRARAQAAMGNASAARADLDRALQLVPADPFAWYMSAALARRESNLTRARTDIGRAMQLAPDNPDIVLLAGTLAGLGGNMAEAERLYRRVAEGAPDTDAGRTARASLETLREVEVPAGTAPAAPAPQAPPPQAQPQPQPQPQLR